MGDGTNPEDTEKNRAINSMAEVLMSAWEEAEGERPTASYVATFADMARAVVDSLQCEFCGEAIDLDLCAGYIMGDW